MAALKPIDLDTLTDDQIAAAKHARALYMREWRKTHKANSKAAQTRYWLRTAEKQETEQE